mgnify:FL=1
MGNNAIEKIGIRLPTTLHDPKLVFILGPCVIESAEGTFDIARKLVEITERLDVPFIFKASYDKANRTSVESYRGPGIKEGLAILHNIKQEFGIPVTGDIHSVEEIEKVAQVLDIIQIPAFLSRQNDLLVESGRTGKIINIKKAQFMSPWDVSGAVKKVLSTGNDKIMLTERGSSFGYNNLVVDFRSIEIMKKYAPVIFDATHSVQRPGGMGDKSAGDREFIVSLARAAIAAGATGLFMEVHPEPDKALCDGPNMFPLHLLEDFLKEIKELFEFVKKLKKWKI